MATAHDALLAALKVKWDASPTLAGINGPYRKSKPPNLNVGFPYCIVDDLESQLERYTCASQHWEVFLNFVVYDKTPELCAASAALIDAVFDSDGLSLTINGHSLIRHRKTTEDYSEKDKTVNSVSLSYEFLVSRPRV